MSNITIEEIDAWFDQAVKDLPPKNLANLFGITLRKISRRASLTLNKVTIMAIIDRVLKKSSEQFPLLQNLKADYEEIEFEQFSVQFEHADPCELMKSFKYLFHELFKILGNLSSDIVIIPLPMTEETAPIEVVDSLASKKLESFYEISKCLASFEGVEQTFPEVLRILAGIYSFKTVILHQDRYAISELHTWHDAKVSDKSIEQALIYSQNNFDYLVRPLETILSCKEQKHILPISSFSIDHPETTSRYISMPLTLPSIKSFGILQFETFTKFSESDLRFISSITNLIAITLDRHNQILEADQKRRIEMFDTQKHVETLQKEKELREQFVMTLTHDLRTPLTAAKIGAQFILRRPENAEKVQQLAVKIIRNIDRMDQMIRDLLDTNRIRAGECLSLSMGFCDLKEMAIVTLRELGISHGDRFVLEAPRENFNGFWNEDGVRRVIENLATNAIKYGNKNFVKVSLAQNAEDVFITVHNDGNPIPKNELDKLFLPFHRTLEAETGGKKGWGLGLTLVQGVVEAHGGKVTVESSAEHGTEFYVRLPKDARAHQLLN